MVITKNKIKKQGDEHKMMVRFSLASFVVFSLSVLLVSAVLAHWLAEKHLADSAAAPVKATDLPDTSSRASGPWGDLSYRDITLNIPEEYAAFDANTNQIPTWAFPGLTPTAARDLMLASGLSAKQIALALAQLTPDSTGTNTVITPDRNLVFSLTPEVRGKFYSALAHYPANRYMAWPFYYPSQSFDTCMADVNLDPELVANVKKLLYVQGRTQILSDFPTAMRLCRSDAERLTLAKALTRQVSVLAGLRVHADSDIKQLVQYWAHGNNTSFTESLFESLQQREIEHETPSHSGSTISLTYLLPTFARARLYTFPTPAANDPVMDCHWSSFNFFNTTPDNRISDPNYTADMIKNEYHEIPKPEKLGDVFLFLDNHGNGIHSCVYIAGDIVFTKNGNNAEMPWKLMHLEDVKDIYTRADYTPVIKVLRANNF